MTIMRVIESGDYVLVYDSEECIEGVGARAETSLRHDVLTFAEKGKPGWSRLLHGVPTLTLTVEFTPDCAGALWVHRNATEEQITEELSEARRRNRRDLESLSGRLAAPSRI